MRSARPLSKTRQPHEVVRRALGEHLEVVQQIEGEAEVIVQAAGAIVRALRAGKKILIFGNGGSAADAQHMAAELVGRFETDRAGLAAIALTGNSSNLTAISNDYGYGEVFARQIEALGRSGDVAIGITTSGQSDNVLRALKTARSASLVTVALTGRAGLAFGDVDVHLRVASDRTARVQEAHILAIHCICELVERQYFDPPPSARGIR